jgi:hypothetical protein
MPDLLTHLGTSYAALRGTAGRDRLGAILLGGFLPDLAWIARRAIEGLTDADPVALSAWLIPWHTPFVMLFVTAAAAAFARRPWSTFGILFAAVLVHHAFDAAQTRYGSGVLWLYPASLRETSWGLFWPESAANHLLAVASLFLLLGLAFGRIDRRQSGAVAGPAPAAGFSGISPGSPVRRPLPWLVAAACAAIVVPTAAATRERLIESNVYGMRLAARPETLEGRQVALDRDRIASLAPLEVEAFNGRRFGLADAGGGLAVGDVVSIRGGYEGGVIRVRDLHRHRERLRDLYSYLGLGLLAVLLRRPRHGMISGR